MTISEAIAQVRAVTGQVVADAAMVRWLSELDGRIAVEFFGTDFWRDYSTDDLGSRTATDQDDGAACELLIPTPWDSGIYVHWLAAQTYLANGEYDRYENERVYAETQLDEFKKHMVRTLKPACQMLCEQMQALMY